MKSHDQMVAEWMKDTAFKQEYEALESQFALFDELLKGRHKAGLTQNEVAQRMGTKATTDALLPRLKTGSI